VDGKRVYVSARAGIEVKMDPRPVEVREFEITRFAGGEIDFRISCSKGTYIRSLARDLGEKLGVGAYLKALCRTRIGTYNLQEAKTLTDLVDEIKLRSDANS
jgi:tRNA pseudouridine55 synthase